MLRGILTVGGWTMVSRILGFARDVLIAALVGAGPVADAFFLANRLPNLFRRLFGEGAFNAAFVPGFTSVLAREGQEAAQHFAEQAAAVLAFWLVALTVLAEIFMPEVIGIFLPGFTGDPALFELAVTLARITFPYMPLICLAALFSGVLNGLNRFAAAAAAPVLYNIVSIGCMLLLVPYVPSAGHALAWGVSLSGVAQLALLVWAVRRAGMRITLPRPRLTPQMRVLFRRMAPGLVGAGAMQLNLFIDGVIISLLPASTASVLYFADRIAQLPLGVIGVAVGTALLPTLSRQREAGDADGARASLNRALEVALALILPAALALALVALPIVTVLFQRGAFDAADAAQTARALAAYALGLPAYVLIKVLTPGFFARGDTSTPVRVALGSVALNIVLNLAFMVPLGYLGPAMASSVSAWANVIALAVLLARAGHLAPDAILRRRLPRMALAAAAMGAALLALEHVAYAPFAADPALRWAGLAVLVAGGLAAYGLAGTLFGAFRPRDLLRRR
jgi:putative peptidoglycan lipid II flippase